MNPSASTPLTAQAPHEHRSRLLQGMASVVVEKAFADITVADIVRAAGVSKRSFYEHFDSKEACFLALYSAASASALRTLQAAVSPDQAWQDQIEQGLNAYLSTLAAVPGLVRALFIDIHYLGDDGARARREVMQALADFMLDSTRLAVPVLSPTLAMGAVGAINELILQAIERDGVAQLAELTQPASALVRLLTGAQLAPEKNPDRM